MENHPRINVCLLGTAEDTRSFGQSECVEEPHNAIDHEDTASSTESHPEESIESAKPKLKRKKRSELRWWLPEILASVLSLVSFTSLVVLIGHYQDRRLDDLRLPGSLTLNALVSIIATINKAALMIPVGSIMSQEVWLWLSKRRGRLADLELSDAASRGAWGSAKFLLQPRKRWLGSCGAIVTITALAFTTLTQQLIAIRPFPVNEDALKPGNLPRIELWINFTGTTAESGYAAVTIPLTMKAAIYNGMMSEGIEFLTAPCPTGNCTWPQTPTLAVCGECVKSTYKTSCDNSTCRYTMPSGNVAVQGKFWSSETLYQGYGFNVMPGPGATYLANDSSIIYISNFDVFGAPYNSYGGHWPNASTVSSECALWMCIQVMKVTTTNSQQVQNTPVEFSKVENSSLFVGDSSVNLAFVSPTPLSPGNAPNYTVGAMVIEFFQEYLKSIINGTVYLNFKYQDPSSDTTQAIWYASADLDAWIKNLARSMTNVARTNIPAAANAIYDGTGYQLGIKIRWGWITLPALLVLASGFILLGAIEQTSRSPAGAWKGSPLTLLFMDVDPNIKQRGIAKIDDFDGLQNAVKRDKIVLKSGSDGGRILKQY